MERPGLPEKSNRGTGGKVALQRAITWTAVFPYHTPNETDILIPTGSSTICGCEESRITVSYCAAGRRGSRVPNRQVMSLRARPLSYIGENANLRIKSSFGNGLFLLFFSSSTYGQFPFYYYSHSRLPHSFYYNLTGTRLRGCVRILYMVQSSFPFIIFTTVTDFPIFGIRTQLHSLRFALMS